MDGCPSLLVLFTLGFGPDGGLIHPGTFFEGSKIYIVPKELARFGGFLLNSLGM